MDFKETVDASIEWGTPFLLLGYVCFTLYNLWSVTSAFWFGVAVLIVASIFGFIIYYKWKLWKRRKAVKLFDEETRRMARERRRQQVDNLNRELNKLHKVLVEQEKK